MTRAGASSLTRSRFVAGATSAAAAVIGRPLLAGLRQDTSRIDIHHHHLSPRFIAEARTHRAFPPSSLDWTPQRSLEDMDRAGVAKGMLSIPTPGVWFGDLEAARRLARSCNDYGAGLVRDHPSRFGLFGVLPMPDVDASLREIAYVLDELRGSGIGLFSSYGRTWLGDAAYAPLFAELDRRAALVFIHPILNGCCDSLVPDVPDTLIEYGTDTTRTIASLVFSGAAARYTNIRFVFSHGGGTMPYLITRFIEYAKTPAIATKLPVGAAAALQSFYYDTAWVTNRAAIAALIDVVPPSQILFGTDYPARSAPVQVAELGRCGLASADLDGIFAANARRLLNRPV